MGPNLVHNVCVAELLSQGLCIAILVVAVVQSHLLLQQRPHLDEGVRPEKRAGD